MVAFVVSMTGSWELTFVIFITIPLIFISYRASFAMLRGTQSEGDNPLSRASHVVTESVQNIKTVVSLGAEEYLVKVVRKNLKEYFM